MAGSKLTDGEIMTEENQTEDPITTSEAPELPEVEGQEPNQATLGVADLQNAAQVGQVFNRLVAFIESVQAQQNPESAEAPAEAQ